MNNTHISSRTKTTLSSMLTGILVLCLLPVTAALSNALQDVSFATLPGDRVQIKLRMQEPASEPASFTIDNPARIALDFPATTVNLPRKSQEIGIGVARSVNAVEAGGRTRVVINLVKLVGYTTAVSGNDVIITLNDSSAGAFTTAAEKPATTTTAQTAAGVNILNLDFRRGSKGEGRVELTLADPNTAVDMVKRGKQVIVTLKNSALSEDLERRLDVIDFATPVQTVDAFNHGSDVRMIISAISDFDHIAYQADEKLTIDVKPIIKKEEPETARRKFGYTGERLSLNFQNIEVRAVLQLIADFTGINMVTSDTVSGNLTLRLKNVPWDQALDIVLKTKGLAKRESGNVMLIAPTEEIAAREKLELEASKQIVELAPLINETVQVNYAKASDLAALIQSKEKTFMSARGSINIDQRTNKLLVQDTAENVDLIIALVEELDIPIRQVLIESRIVLASNQFTRELGVKFGVSSETISGSRSITTSGSLNAADDYNRLGAVPPLDERLNVNLPAVSSSAGSIGLAIAKLPFGTLLDLELSAAQAEGKSETVSSPKVITADQQEAIIESGQEIPYQEASSSGATSVAFKKAVLSLKVTPQITPDDRIVMDLIVNKDSPDFGNLVQGVPPINTQNVETQVLVDNGETVVLGGVYEQTKTKSIDRIPFFGDLPLVGGLFRSKTETNDKQELLIFVTPKLLKEDISL
jgi:type IV pilus assembly protein PilQ